MVHDCSSQGWVATVGLSRSSESGFAVSEFEGSLQHHDFLEGGGHVTYARCESCMWGQHFEEVTWHSWADSEDIEWAQEKGDDVEIIKVQKCACDCAGPRGAKP